MTTKQAREIFNQVAAVHLQNGKRDQAAQVEIVREFFTNPTFRTKLADYLWERAV